ncbi:MAG TPA: LysM domain-containing protein [Opitutaceae bacterium]
MTFRLPYLLCALIALLLAAGCERPDGVGLTAEIDEANYRRGKDLLRQGRNQEALGSFLKVIEKRGDGAPESHLEVGLLYQSPIFKDPIAAIYHFRKYCELKPNSPQTDLVRQRIDAAMREFGRTLPAQPLENQLLRNDQLDVIESLRRENAELKNELAVARANVATNTARGTIAQLGPAAEAPAEEPARRPPYPGMDLPSPITRVPPEPETGPALVQPPTRPATTPTTVPSAPGRRHVVAAKESLYSIARKYYGTPTNAKIDEIVAANRAALPDGRNTALRVGMELRIP